MQLKEMTRLLVAGGVVTLLVLDQASAQALTGTIRDAETDEPLPGATVYVPTLQRGTISDEQGAYRLAFSRAGTHRVVYSFIGYQNERRTVTIGDEPLLLDVALAPTAVEAPPITITAKAYASDVLTSPQSVSVVEGRQLAENTGQTAFEAIEQTPGVRLMRTGATIAKPVVRGLTAQRVLVVQDGVRQEGQQWGDEHGPELDALAFDRIEVLRGPASLLYGSDALGGVVQAASGSLAAYDRPASGTLLLQGLSNARQAGGYLQVGGRLAPFAYEGAVSVKRSGSYATPEGVVPNTGTGETSASLRLGRAVGAGNVEVDYRHYEARLGLFEPEIPLSDDDRFRIGLPYQRVAHDRARVQLGLPVADSRLEVVASVQQNRRREFAEHGDDEGPVLEAHSLEPELFLRLTTATTDVRLHHRPVSQFFGTVGVSGFWQQNETLAEETLIPGARTWNGAGYLYEEWVLPQLTLNGGLRYDVRRLDVDGNEALGVAAQIRHYGALSGALGLAWQPHRRFSAALNAGRAWRAPVLSELFSNGVHEGTVRFEQGTPSLGPEESFSLDATLRYLNPHVYVEAGGYVNTISNFIFPRPTGRVDPASGYYVYVYDQAQARLWGAEVTADVHPHPYDWIHFNVTADVTYTKNRETGDRLPFSPTPRLRAEVRFDRKTLGPLREARLRLGPTLVARQAHPAPEETATDGYVLWDATFSTRIRAGAVTLTPVVAVDNLFDTAYTAPLSRLKPYGILEPGRNVRFSLRLSY